MSLEKTKLAVGYVIWGAKMVVLAPYFLVRMGFIALLIAKDNLVKK